MEGYKHSKFMFKCSRKIAKIAVYFGDVSDLVSSYHQSQQFQNHRYRFPQSSCPVHGPSIGRPIPLKFHGDMSLGCSRFLLQIRGLSVLHPVWFISGKFI